MNRSSPKKNRRKLIVIGAILIILIALLLFISVYISRHKKSNSSGNQSVYNNTKKEATVNNNGVPVNNSGNKNSAPDTSYQPPDDSNGITITPLKSDSSVILTTKLVGYSDGTCDLKIINGSKVFDQTSNVIYASNYSTCAGFTIPIDKLGTGIWSISISVSSGDLVNSKTVSYEVK